MILSGHSGSYLENAKFDTIAFIKNEHYRSMISFSTQKIIKYIPPPEGYPRNIGRADQLDLFFNWFKINDDSAHCTII